MANLTGTKRLTCGMLTIWQSLSADILSVCRSTLRCPCRATGASSPPRRAAQTSSPSRSRRSELGPRNPGEGKRSHSRIILCIAIDQIISLSSPQSALHLIFQVQQPHLQADALDGILVGDLQHLHGADHALHRHEDVLKDEFDEAALVLVRVAGPVDDAHLLDEGRLARLSSAWMEEVTEWNEVQANISATLLVTVLLHLT